MYLINILSSTLIAILAFATLAFDSFHQNKIGLHLRVSLLFFGITFLLILVLCLLKEYQHDLVFVKHTWIATATDSLSNFSLIICAYSLSKGTSFKWNNLYGLYLAAIVLIIIISVLGILIQNENIVWRLFYITPSALMASFALIFLATVAFKEPSFIELKWPILIVFCTISLIQIPGYVLHYVPVPSNQDYEDIISEGIAAITLFSSVGKLVLIFIFIGLLINAYGADQSKKFVTITNILVSLLSIGFGLLVLFYRVATTIDLYNS